MIGANRWDRSEIWPPATAREERWYLEDGKLGRTAPQTGALSYRYDPSEPTPSIGGPICCTGGLALPEGPMDQRPNADRPDVLSFMSDPLDKPLTIVGDIRTEIAFSSDAPDTDLVAILVDIAPDGTMLAIQQGALRLRYRNGFDQPALMTPGQTVQAPIAFPPIAYQIAAGHRIGLHLSSASFPRLERNLNTGGANYLATDPLIATNTVHFGAEGSVLILPIVPEQVNP